MEFIKKGKTNLHSRDEEVLEETDKCKPSYISLKSEKGVLTRRRMMELVTFS